MYKALSTFAVLALAHATQLGAATEAESESATELQANLQTEAQAEVSPPELNTDFLAQIEAQAEVEA